VAEEKTMHYSVMVHSQLSEGPLVRGIVLGSSKVIQTAKNSLPQRCSEKSWPNPNPRTSEPSDNWADTQCYYIASTRAKQP